MMPHQAFKRGAIHTPIMLTQAVCGVFVHCQFVHDVLRHGAIHHREDMGRCVVERVVEIENPDFFRSLIASVAWQSSSIRKVV